MNREIKFRGLRTDNNEFVYGLFELKEQSSIIGNYYVTSESLGQFTGLKDINDFEIYEGDICRHLLKSNIKGEISFFEGSFIIGKSLASNSLINFNCPKSFLVIGNIYENPELLLK